MNCLSLHLAVWSVFSLITSFCGLVLAQAEEYGETFQSFRAADLGETALGHTVSFDEQANLWRKFDTGRSAALATAPSRSAKSMSITMDKQQLSDNDSKDESASDTSAARQVDRSIGVSGEQAEHVSVSTSAPASVSGAFAQQGMPLDRPGLDHTEYVVTTPWATVYSVSHYRLDSSLFDTSMFEAGMEMRVLSWESSTIGRFLMHEGTRIAGAAVMGMSAVTVLPAAISQRPYAMAPLLASAFLGALAGAGIVAVPRSLPITIMPGAPYTILPDVTVPESATAELRSILHGITISGIF